MKVLFLDVDGVLALGRLTYVDDSIPPTPIGILVEELQFKTLRRIILQTGASIVLSSDWRLDPNLVDELNRTLDEFLIPRPIDHTPFQDGEYLLFEEARTIEIKKWLDKHPEVQKFAILDDLDLVGFGSNFFQTECDFMDVEEAPEDGPIENFGLTKEIADKVIAHLNKEE